MKTPSMLLRASLLLGLSFLVTQSGCTVEDVAPGQPEASGEAAPTPPSLEPPAAEAGARSDRGVDHLHSALQARPDLPLIDVRSRREYEAGHVPGARLLPVQELGGRLDELAELKASGDPIYVICQSGGRSARAADRLVEEGFAEVVNVEGGTAAWIAAGHEVSQDSQPVPSP